ncbi:exopolyphosphatase [Alteribacillus sp. HJP-4]|uniref:exopolyphosphatase n=1 Tax=Alteribacillus sp. HJP-4 TaxID=2775394 RepID=UPI0035CD2006
MKDIKEKVGVIDIGSNSIRLVIHEVDEKRGFREIHNLKKVARLSDHINEEQKLTIKGFEVLKNALIQFEEVMSFHRVASVQAVATAAIRNAANQQRIIDYIQTETSLPVRVLSGEEEAYYGYLAVVNSTSVKEGITIDIGGGSTEITMFKDKKLIHSHSFPFGALTLKKKYLQDTNGNKAELKKLASFVKDEFSKLEWLHRSKLPVIGIGGSARNMALVHQAETKYPLSGLHQYIISTKGVMSTLDLFESNSLSERENIEGLSKDRADVIIPAVRVIHLLIEHVSAPYFMMSNKGLRDGLLYEELLKDYQAEFFPEAAEESFFQLMREFEMHEDYVQEVGRIARQLYEQFEPHLPEKLLHEENERLLRMSARVLYIGEFISGEASSQHTFYLLTNRSIDGISHRERLAMAFIASFKSKSWLKQFAQPFDNYLTKDKLKRLELLGSLLKLAYSLNRTHRKIVQHIEVADHSKALNVHIFCRDNTASYFEEVKSDKYKKHIEKVLNKDIELHFHE